MATAAVRRYIPEFHMKAFPAAFVALVSFFCLAPLANAQSPGAAQANDAAYALFSAGDYQGAAAAYEKLLKDYPTDSIVPLATIQLAYSQFFLADFAKAQATLAKATSVPLAPEMSELAAGFLPQILAAKASAMSPGDSGRKAAFEEAVKKYSEFIEKYPKSAEIESAVFGRAVSNYQIENFDKTIEDMRSNLQRFAQSATIDSSRNLLALALATQGSRELVKDGGDKAKGLAQLDEAEKLLREVISSKRDISLMNDSYFQVGEILFTKGAFDQENRSKHYAAALDAYRSILPKTEIITLQKEKIASFPARKAEALRARNEPLRKQLDKDNERELRRLSEIQGKPDQIATALLKSGEMYFNAGDYNAARVLIQHATPTLGSDDEKLRALFFTTMTYALQQQVDKAVAGYKQFTASYKNPPIAENLPLALGSMYLGLGNPTEAITYFDESIKQYPNGRFLNLSVVQKAQAQATLKQYADALKTFQDYLAKNPPPEVAVVAQSGLAGIYKDTGKWDEAIAEYTKVKDKFPTTPQAVDAEYWIAVCTQQKGDNATAVPLLQAFIKNHSDNPLAPLAYYGLGTAQIQLGQKPEGMATLADLAEKFPESTPAPFTYFIRAQQLAAEQKGDEVIALMRAFAEKYPSDDKIYFAYDSIAQTNGNTGKPDEAIATYTEFAGKYPQHPKATEALIKIADLQRANAERIATNYASLSPEEQVRWKDALSQSVSTIEGFIAKYPDSPDLPAALQSLLTTQRMLLRSELRQPAEVEKYLEELASNATSSAAKSKIQFALAGLIAETDKKRALAKMNETFSADLVYSPKDLDAYGLLLVDDKKLDEAAAVFEKLRKDYPIQPGVPAAQIPVATQEAQAVALFGLGRVAQEKKQTAEAGKLFQQLKALYPWSPKVLEADYGIAESARAAGNLDEAQQILTGVVRAPNATAELRAGSFLLLSQITEQRMETESDPKKKTELLNSAIDNYLKISQFYGGVPSAAAEGLWKGAQLIEQQVAASTDAKFKTQQTNRARDAYKTLIKDYPSSEFAPKAQQRLTALGNG